MWWGAVAVAIFVGAVFPTVLLAARTIVEVNRARSGSMGAAGWPEVAAGLVVITMLVSPVLFWSGFAARVVKRWWMTGVLTALTTLLIFPAAVLVMEAPQARPFMSKILDPDESVLRLFASLGLISFLIGTLVHGACRWLLIRPQPDAVAACWKCGYSRRGLGDAVVCPECGTKPAAPTSRCGRIAGSRWSLRIVATIVLLALVGAGATAGWKYWHNTRPTLAMLRAFGGSELVMATGVPVDQMFAGRAAMRALPNGWSVVLMVPDPRTRFSIGDGLPAYAAQMFVSRGVNNGWVSAAWMSGQSTTGYALLTESQFARLAAGVPQGLLDEIVAPTHPDTTKSIKVSGLERVDVRPWLGD